MNQWQADHIKGHLQFLVESISCNTELLAILKDADVLAEVDAQQLAAKKTSSDKAYLLCDILKSRVNGYKALLKALIKTKQTGAAAILLGASILNSRVQFLQRVYQVKEFMETEKILAWLQEDVFTTTYEQIFDELANGKVLKLVKDTIPKPDPLYVPRILTRRLQINPKLFRSDCRDIFVFRNVERAQLRKVIGIQSGIEASTDLLSKKKKNRFILLKNYNHWELLRRNATQPMHLIRFESETTEFLLETTTGSSELLYQYLEHGNEVSDKFVKEGEFVRKTMENDVKGICICDSPGMGKSLLLANVARKVSEKCQNQIVAFIQLRHFNTARKQKGSYRDAIMEHVCRTALAHVLLNAITEIKKTKWVLFFDGLDEMRSDNIDKITKLIANICKSMPESKIFATSRPVVRQKLEKAVQAISYDIKPFDEETQAKFLVSVWASEIRDCSLDNLTDYARKLVSKLKNSLKKNECSIAGTPLLCKMIADVFQYEAFAYAERVSNSLSDNKVVENVLITLRSVYAKYMERQLGESKCNFKCMKKADLNKKERQLCDDFCQVKSYHVWYALKLIFPEIAEKIYDQVFDFAKLSALQIFQPEILQNSTCEKYEFVHRTFAEYLVAEYFAKSGVIGQALADNTDKELEQNVFNNIFVLRSDFKGYYFCENVSLYFLNAFIEESGESARYFGTVKLEPLSERFFNITKACLCSQYETLTEIILKAALREKPHLNQISTNYIVPIIFTLDKAASICTVSTVKFLCECFSDLFKTDILNEDSITKHKDYINLFRRVIWHANYEMAVFFVDTLNLKTKGFLGSCLYNTYSENDEHVEKRLDIARLLLSKRPSMVKPSCGRKSSIKAGGWHIKAFKFVLESGADLLTPDEEGLTVFHRAATYMLESDFLEMCRVVLVGRQTTDLLAALSGDERITFRLDKGESTKCSHASALFTVLHLINSGVNELLEKHVDFVWQTDEPLLNRQTALFSPGFFQTHHDEFVALLRIGVQEGHLPAVKVALELLTEREIGCGATLPRNENKQHVLFLAVLNTQRWELRYLTRVSENSLSVNGWTVFRLVSSSVERQVFQRAARLLSTFPFYVINALLLKTDDKKLQKGFERWVKAEIGEGTHSITPIRMQTLRPTPVLGQNKFDSIHHILTTGTCLRFEAGSVATGSSNTGLNCVDQLSLIFELMKIRPYSQTLAYIAVENKRIEVFECLVSRGENVLPVNGRTIFAVAAATKDVLFFHRVLEILGRNTKASDIRTSAKSDPSAGIRDSVWKPDELLMTPLHDACLYLDLPEKTLDLLLACGTLCPIRNTESYYVDINAVDLHGKTALMYALCNERSLEFVKLLVSRGADWRIRTNEGNNVAHLCCDYGLIEHLKYFIDLGCNINELDKSGNNALYYALCKCGDLEEVLELIKNLVRAGLDANHKNKNGETAYDIAVNKERPAEILSLLSSICNQ